MLMTFFIDPEELPAGGMRAAYLIRRAPLPTFDRVGRTPRKPHRQRVSISFAYGYVKTSQIMNHREMITLILDEHVALLQRGGTNGLCGAAQPNGSRNGWNVSR
jgi:hypothetical protein